MAKLFCFVFVTLLGLSTGEEDTRPCLPLPECESLMFMVRNKDDIPGMNRADVFR